MKDLKVNEWYMNTYMNFEDKEIIQKGESEIIKDCGRLIYISWEFNGKTICYFVPKTMIIGLDGAQRGNGQKFVLPNGEVKEVSKIMGNIVLGTDGRKYFKKVLKFI